LVFAAAVWNGAHDGMS